MVPPPYEIHENVPRARHHRLVAATPKTFPYGLAVVHKQASSHPECFQGWRAEHMPMVTDIPIGQVVLCLPYAHSDIQWRAVIVIREYEGVELARLTWMHPECILPLTICRSELSSIVKIEMTKGRGSRGPSVRIPQSDPGIKWTKDSFHTEYAAPPAAGPRGRLILDARWDFRSYGTTDRCSGHCLKLCMNIILDPQILAAFIRFAQLSLGERQSYVCCSYAKHRSVAVGVLLQALMRFNVDFSEAARDHSDQCCRTPAMDNIPVILTRLREIPILDPAPATSLAAALDLEGWIT
jgi:hypothetical protein